LKSGCADRLHAGCTADQPGFLKAFAPVMFAGVGPFWAGIYTYAWFIGVLLAPSTYTLLMRPTDRRLC
jgi:NCS1 family nucleobase:cation symporter-1